MKKKYAFNQTILEIRCPAYVRAFAVKDRFSVYLGSFRAGREIRLRFASKAGDYAVYEPSDISELLQNGKAVLHFSDTPVLV